MENKSRHVYLRSVAPALLLGLLSAGCQSPASPRVAPPRPEAQNSSARSIVERLDPRLDALIPADAHWTVLARGLKWTEGPVWLPEGYLLFAEIPSNSIRKLVPGQPPTIFLQPSGYKGSEPYGGPEPGSNGMTLDPSGRITVAGHAARDIFRFDTPDPHGSITILADSYQGKRLNSPNDLVFGPDGSLYFTDPPYGLRKQDDTDPAKQLSFNGVYRIPNAASIPAGAAPDRAHLQLLIRDLPRPNGIAFSPDGKTLYVDNSTPKFWMRYPVRPDGTLGSGTKLLDGSSETGKGAPDGMKLDILGNVYSAGPGGIWIISPSGKHLGTLRLPNATGNLAWGGPDGQTIFVTSSGEVLSLHVKVRGLLPNQWR